MGKPITQSSLKISKNQSNHHFNTRNTKIVKPKVYITHSSNFMALVQKVTGKDSSSSSSSSSTISSFSPPATMPMVSPPEPPCVIHLDHDHGSPDHSLDNMFMPFDYSYCSSDLTQVIHIDDHESPNPSLDYSHDPSLDNSFMQSDYSYGSSEELGVQWPQDGVMDYVNEIELRNLESWLLDFDPSTSIHDGSFVPMNTYEYQYGYNFPSIM